MVVGSNHCLIEYILGLLTITTQKYSSRHWTPTISISTPSQWMKPSPSRFSSWGLFRCESRESSPVHSPLARRGSLPSWPFETGLSHAWRWQERCGPTFLNNMLVEACVLPYLGLINLHGKQFYWPQLDFVSMTMWLLISVMRKRSLSDSFEPMHHQMRSIWAPKLLRPCQKSCCPTGTTNGSLPRQRIGNTCVVTLSKSRRNI